MSASKTLCYLSSLESKEKMHGTAPQAGVWFLLEYRGHWSGKAYKDSRIPKAVKSHLNKELKKVSGSRLQLIKKHKNTDNHLKLFIAVSDETDPRLYELKFNSYEDLLKLKIKKILKSKKHISNEKLFIICTNGEYDTCCGKIGMPVYLDISKGKYGPQTWEANHIGGHRFASTFVCLPHGLVYGRATDGKEAEELMGQYEEGKVNIESFRGRSCYKSEIQAAEYYLRKETGITEVSDLVLKNSKKSGKKFSVKFLSKSDKKTYRVKIRLEKKAVKTIKSCGDGRTSVPQYIFLDHKVD